MAGLCDEVSGGNTSGNYLEKRHRVSGIETM
jgi:hypothetical protein